MILGNEEFTLLKKSFVLSERSISSHWIEYLKDFNYEKGGFSMGLDDTIGSERIKFKMFLNYILQTPFRMYGAQF